MLQKCTVFTLYVEKYSWEGHNSLPAPHPLVAFGHSTSRIVAPMSNCFLRGCYLLSPEYQQRHTLRRDKKYLILRPGVT